MSRLEILKALKDRIGQKYEVLFCLQLLVETAKLLSYRLTK